MFTGQKVRGWIRLLLFFVVGVYVIVFFIRIFRPRLTINVNAHRIDKVNVFAIAQTNYVPLILILEGVPDKDVALAWLEVEVPHDMPCEHRGWTVLPTPAQPKSAIKLRSSALEITPFHRNDAPGKVGNGLLFPPLSFSTRSNLAFYVRLQAGILSNPLEIDYVVFEPSKVVNPGSVIHLKGWQASERIEKITVEGTRAGIN